MYKPHTIEQYKVYRFLEENFALEHFLLAPLSRFGLMLEDKTGEKIAFAFLNDCVQEIPIPAPAAPETVIAFLKQFRSLTPRPVVHDFEALEMSRNVQSGNTQNLKSMVIQRSFPKWSVAERRKTAAASDQAAVCACAHSRYFAGGSPSGLRV